MRITGSSTLICLALLGGCAPAVAAPDLYRVEGRWEDDQAHVVTLGALRGEYSVVTLAYGACRRVCSTSLRLMEQLQSLADQRGVALNFIVIGLDPEQDKPADWAEIHRSRAHMRSNWRFLSGDPRTVRRVADHLGVRYWRYGEHTLHDFRLTLVSPQGQTVRSIDAFDADLAGLLP